MTEEKTPKPARILVVCVVDEHVSVRRWLASPAAPPWGKTATLFTALPLHRITEDAAVAAVWTERDDIKAPGVFAASEPLTAAKFWTPDRDTGGRVHTAGFLSALGERIVPAVVKHRDDMLRVAYA